MEHEITDRDKASFEVGIKLGALFHQFTEMPISPEILKDVERTIEKSVSLQPYVKEVSVSINEDLVRKRLSAFKYCGLSGDMFDIKVKVKYGKWLVTARLKYDKKLRYPLMYLEKIESED